MVSQTNFLLALLRNRTNETDGTYLADWLFLRRLRRVRVPRMARVAEVGSGMGMTVNWALI